MRELLLAAACLASFACDSATDSAGALDITGTWEYDASQASPSLDIDGRLRIDEQEGSFFSGSAELTETDLLGTPRNRTGVLTGSLVGGAAVVQFDMFIGTASRRHVGIISDADSMAGTWAVTAVTPPITGAFSARRVR
jgi:hypothetical protein